MTALPLLEVIFENGILRPLHPLDLAEGTRLELAVIKVADAVSQENEEEVDEAAYMTFLRELDEIAALPLQSEPQPNTARDHDAILYPGQGIIP